MALDISYLNKKIRNICEKESVGKRHFPLSVVRALYRRIYDVSIADHLFDVPFKIDFQSKIPPGSFAIALDEGYFVVFCAVDLNMPLDAHGNVGWTKVRRIKLLEITKYA